MRPQPDNPALDKIAHNLRAAVLAGDHAKARGVSAEYVEALRRHWMRLAPSERAGSELPKLSLELLAWAREMTIVQRAMAGEQLRIAAEAGRYQMARARYLQSAALGAR
jgi:hypothetical protein